MSQQRAFFTETTMPKRDPNLDNAAVKKYREIIHLQANYLQREFIANDVEDSPRGIRIWEATLLEYMARGRNPKDVLEMLKAYHKMMPNNGMIL